MRIIILLVIVIGFITCDSKNGLAQEKAKENNYTVIEDYIQLTGEQALSEMGSVSIPFSKQGYTLHLPDSNPIATLIFASGSALDTTRNIDEFAIIKPARRKSCMPIFTQIIIRL